jgi:hypothetical protein
MVAQAGGKETAGLPRKPRNANGEKLTLRHPHLFACLAAVENAQQHQPFAIVAILKDIARVENLQHDLPVFLATRERSAKPRKQV